ncbi:hypothetical protein YC2023_100596 [Brassica napus]
MAGRDTLQLHVCGCRGICRRINLYFLRSSCRGITYDELVFSHGISISLPTFASARKSIRKRDVMALNMFLTAAVSDYGACVEGFIMRTKLIRGHAHVCSSSETGQID